VLNGMLDKTGVEAGLHASVLRALDKIEKQGAEVARAEMKKAGVDAGRIEKIMAFTGMKGNGEKMLAECKKYSSEGTEELSELLALCREYGLECELDLALVRGLDYYTGPIFEIDAGPGVGSVAGGGRYDNMLTGYGHAAPATGISLGIERIMALLSEKCKAEKRQLAYIAPLGAEQHAYAIKVANELRAAGICCEIDVMGRPIGKQLQYAAGVATHAIIIGEKEQKAETVKVKDLSSGKEEEVQFGQVAAFLAKG
jgi:histidyl-tRNA synthetase